MEKPISNSHQSELAYFEIQRTVGLYIQEDKILHYQSLRNLRMNIQPVQLLTEF
jgi:hypothetical protein